MIHTWYGACNACTIPLRDFDKKLYVGKGNTYHEGTSAIFLLILNLPILTSCQGEETGISFTSSFTTD